MRGHITRTYSGLIAAFNWVSSTKERRVGAGRGKNVLIIIERY
jgi:hypothetical protein